jgi:autotransporter adhesin
MGRYSSALGAGSLTANGPAASGNYAVAIGGGDGGAASGVTIVGARANGLASTAVGPAARAIGEGSAAFGLGSRALANFSLALGRRARAEKPQAVAIGNNSIAHRPQTVSVGRVGFERRIMNVAAGSRPTDAVNLAQVKALITAATGASPQAMAKAMPPAPPAVSVVRVGLNSAKDSADGIRRELSELRALVKEQQKRIAQLESRIADTASTR